MSSALLRMAAVLMLLIGGLHAVAAVIAGVMAAGMAGVLPTVAAMIVAAGLVRGWRWLAWLAMLGAIVAIGAVLGRVGAGPVPDILHYLLLAAYAVFVVLTFAALWQGRDARVADRSEPVEIGK
ncbi:hypothetical protein [Roseovarius sp.]|uniref:hypothetical protein n=1 Tax=Roseovarius sp. TaxID=1486281 RepID=UPI00261955F6|nr:hypothetical protein [Roseovarius sp.]MDM8165059.1 hypothetical protein [Roseovarius sp.]